jgi:hypothetical protein
LDKTHRINTSVGLVVSEEDFTTTVIEYAQALKWRVAHFRPGLTQTGKWRTAVQGDGKGFPDLVLVRPHRVIFAELKSNKGKLSDEQEKWVMDLKRSEGVECYVWRPDFWSVIERILE